MSEHQLVHPEGSIQVENNNNNKLLTFRDLLPILISCIYVIFFIIIFTFGITYILYSISPDYSENVVEAQHITYN